MAATMKANLEFDASEMVQKTSDLASRLREALLELGQRMAARIESAAKKNAKWIDRTSHARQGLVSRAVMEGSKLVIHLYHSEAYGKWLEIAMQERYAIIMATLRSHYPQVMNLASRLVKGN